MITVKKCNLCLEEKELELFSKVKTKYSKDGYNWRCKSCCSKKAGEWSLKNKERKREYLKEYWIKNPEKVKTWKKKARIVAFEQRKEYNRKFIKGYFERNPGRMNFYSAIRRARKKMATPSWLSEEHKTEMEKLYIIAKELFEKDGIKRHVDHIVPLKSNLVCGLHVPWNLQVLTASENNRKYNKFNLGDTSEEQK